MAGQSAEQTVAKEEGWDHSDAEVVQGLEHVEMEPEQEVDAKDGSKTTMEAKNPWREGQISKADSNSQPENQNEEQRNDAGNSKNGSKEGRRTSFWFSEQVLDLGFGFVEDLLRDGDWLLDSWRNTNFKLSKFPVDRLNGNITQHQMSNVRTRNTTEILAMSLEVLKK